MKKALQSKLEDILESKIISSQLTSGGCINETSVLLLEDRREIFLKINASPPKNFFKAEAKGLVTLRNAEVIKVPEVFAVDDDFLLLEFLAHGKLDQAQFARQLAALHQIKSDYFGFEEDNFIGLSPQINSRASSWGDFFVDYRLLPQAKWANEKRLLKLDDRLTETLELMREELNSHSPSPSLLHGDLWSGNVFYSSEGPALIDPATYYGDPEADVAFTEMFGGFTRDFYDTYNSIIPPKPGHIRRKEFYNLYHLLNHANLFGGSYVKKVKSRLQRI